MSTWELKQFLPKTIFINLDFTKFYNQPRSFSSTYKWQTQVTRVLLLLCFGISAISFRILTLSAKPLLLDHLTQHFRAERDLSVLMAPPLFVKIVTYTQAWVQWPRFYH